MTSPLKSTTVSSRTVDAITVQIRIAVGRILTEPASDGGIVVPRAIVLEFSGGVEFPAGKEIPRQRCVAGFHVAEGIIRVVHGNRAAPGIPHRRRPDCACRRARPRTPGKPVPCELHGRRSHGTPSPSARIRSARSRDWPNSQRLALAGQTVRLPMLRQRPRKSSERTSTRISPQRDDTLHQSFVIRHRCHSRLWPP
jgi:hypothetical protein